MKKELLAMMAIIALLENPLIATAESVIRVAVLDQYHRDFLPEGQQYIIPLFQKDGEKWEVIESVLPPQEWTIAFDGRSYGTISAETSKSQPLNEINNLQDPTGKIHLPGKPVRKTESGKFVDRPFVLVMGGHVADPDNWMRRALPPEMRDRLYRGFRKQYPEVTNCNHENSPESLWKYKYSDIRVIRSYGSRQGDFIAQIELNGYRCGHIPGDAFQPQYFRLPSHGEPHLMSIGLTLIDAGDYDGDGKPELVFSDASEGGDDYNSDGYSIWSSTLTKIAQRTWFYH